MATFDDALNDCSPPLADLPCLPVLVEPGDQSLRVAAAVLAVIVVVVAGCSDYHVLIMPVVVDDDAAFSLFSKRTVPLSTPKPLGLITTNDR